MPDIRETDGMRACLARWVSAQYGPDRTVGEVDRMPGHSGLLYGFDVLNGGATEDRLVIRVPPPGVRQKNNQDVLRQVPVLKLLEDHGVPAPRARFWGGETAWFSVPYLMMSRLEGRPPGDVFDPANGAVPPRDETERLFAQAVEALERMHRIDAASALTGWEAPRLIANEIDHWVPILEKTSDAGWIALGHRARAALHANAPADPVPGLLHGDFYSNNWLFHRGSLTGIVDWESVSLGPRLLDLGWLCMMYDPECWGPARRAHMHWCPPPAFFLERYASAGGQPADIAWYRAQAGYRLGCLTAYYYELHRKGRRHDPAWEVLAESFEGLMSRAVALLD